MLFFIFIKKRCGGNKEDFVWITLMELINIYRVFIKYCVFFKEFSKFATSTSPALGRYWLYKKNGQPIRVTVHSDVEAKLLFYIQGMDCSELEKITFLMNTLY